MYTSSIFSSFFKSQRTSGKTSMSLTEPKTYQIWVGIDERGMEFMVVVPASKNDIFQDEVESCLHEFQASSMREASQKFTEWRQQRWDDFSP
jgi:hypothetical protein